jgi:hypothetical protein
MRMYWTKYSTQHPYNNAIVYAEACLINSSLHVSWTRRVFNLLREQSGMQSNTETGTPITIVLSMKHRIVPTS